MLVVETSSNYTTSQPLVSCSLVLTGGRWWSKPLPSDYRSSIPFRPACWYSLVVAVVLTASVKRTRPIEPISVVFQIGANGVGLLDPGSETNNVEKSAKMDLPFWLAHELYLRQAVSINVPSCFSLKTRKEIQADAACVDLRFRSPYFYELGCKLLPMVADKSIGPFLLYAFTSRYKEILSKSHSISGAIPKFSSKLTKEESQMSEAAQSSMVAFKKWRVGRWRLEKAAILGRKRKPMMPTQDSAS